ncbi:Putrescine importer PuuP [Shewanella sp. OPT22]|nr:Putrescine importer PuuP [Shewanella sp. OPT22]
MKRVLSVTDLTVAGIAYMTPVTVFTTYGIVTVGTDGHVAAAYLVTLCVIMFTAVSYARMSKAIPASGSAYTYVSHTFGGGLAFIVAWALLLDYILLPMVNYLVIGLYLPEYLSFLPSAFWIIASIVVVTVLNFLGIKLVTRVNVILIGLQILFIIIFCALAINDLSISGQQIDYLAPFYSSNMNTSAVVGGAAILSFSFLGFDSVSTLADEAKHPKKDVPRGIIYCTLVCGVLYVIVAYLGQLVFPNWHLFNGPDTASLQLNQTIGGMHLNELYIFIYMFGLFASALASQASVSRILYSMGKSGALPKVLSLQNKKYGTPTFAILLVSFVSLSALSLSLELASSIISFGALVAFSFVNLSVIKHFYIDNQQRQLIKNGIVPFIGFLMTLWLWTQLSGQAFEVGLLWCMFGVVYLLALTKWFSVRAPKAKLEGQ